MDGTPSTLVVNGMIADFGEDCLRGPDGKPAALRPQAFAVLRLLAERPGRLVTKEELIAGVWPGIAVTDDPYDAISRADAVVVVTEWPEFVKLDPRRVADSMAGTLVIDGRACLDAAAYERAGLRIAGDRSRGPLLRREPLHGGRIAHTGCRWCGVPLRGPGALRRLLHDGRQHMPHPGIGRRLGDRGRQDLPDHSSQTLRIVHHADEAPQRLDLAPDQQGSQLLKL